jgi:hypothetical protein
LTFFIKAAQSLKSTDELYREILRLKSGDSLCRSLKAVIALDTAVQDGDEDVYSTAKKEVKSAKTYLERYLATEKRTLKSFRLRTHDTSLLRLLSRALP